jgi:nicotinamide riboside kinase
MEASVIIAIVGAESTGKTVLARALSERLATATGLRTTWVPDLLRSWCEQQARTPLRHEQADIATEQSRLIDAAAATHELVLCDTTPLMTAVYSEMVFGDTTLYPMALAWQQRCTLSLLTALDLPWVADDMRDGPHAQQPTDTLVRAALAGAKLSYAVVHGSGGERLANAWNAIVSIAGNEGRPRTRARSDAKPASWSWPCEKCSDPECEHRLFSDLIARRE